MTDRIFSLAALTVLELSPPDMVEAAARAGYSHVGLRLVPATEQEQLNSWEQALKGLDNKLGDLMA